jgi:hypothetical protein
MGMTLLKRSCKFALLFLVLTFQLNGCGGGASVEEPAVSDSP